MDELSDDVLIKILSYLSVDDIVVVYDVNRRLRNLSLDRELVRCVRFQNSFSVSDSVFKDFTTRSAAHIQVLDLNHCYWIPSRLIQAAVNRCRQLTELHVIGCSLSIDALANILSQRDHLDALSFSVTSYLDLKQEKLQAAASVLHSLRRLYIFFSASSTPSVLNYVGEHATILNLCHELRSLEIGAVATVLPVIFRPIISNKENFRGLERLVLTDSVHGSAQMFFYSVLAQLPLVDIRWKSLIIPNINFPAFSSNDQFDGCFSHMGTLREFCASYGKIFPTKMLHLDGATELRYLNLRASNISSPDLARIARACHKLTAVDLYQCRDMLTRKVDDETLPETEGFCALLDCCMNLTRLNIANIHFHERDRLQEEIQQAVSQIKGLRSLALPACLLSDETNPTQSDNIETEQKIGSAIGKRRRLDMPSSGQISKRQKRISHTRNRHLQQETEGSSSSTHSPDGSDRVHESCDFLSSLAEQSPNLRELEILGVDFESFFQSRTAPTRRRNNQQYNACKLLNQVTDLNLVSIAKWTRLTTLTLAGLIGVQTGAFLETVTERCCHLRSLSLALLGPSGKCVYQAALTRALRNCRSLHDLRIEQPNLLLNKSFFSSLHSLGTLRRLCIIARNSPFASKDVQTLLTELSKLVVLLMFTGATQTQCSKLKKDLKSNGVFDKDKRPALVVTIAPVQHGDILDVIKSVPNNHYRELLMFGSSVASKPSDDP